MGKRAQNVLANSKNDGGRQRQAGREGAHLINRYVATHSGGKVEWNG